jgi:ABC-type cobalamin/Fe3+-siderophores transport system ATPase subunit
MILRAEGVSVHYPGAPAEALSEVDLSLEPGELVAVAGPNGCGKTTLVRALLGLVPVQRGRVTLNDTAVARWKRAELAQVVALVPQREETPFSWRVAEMVGFGRYAKRGALSPMTRQDREAVEQALARCDVSTLAQRRVETLSGGEWQRVRIARALAQQPRLLVLDEPTASLDLGHEMELFELVRGLVAEGLAALVVSHHLNVVARYAGRMLLLDRGRTAAAGSPLEVMQAELLSRVFRWPVSTVLLEEGSPQIVTLRPVPPARD